MGERGAKAGALDRLQEDLGHRFADEAVLLAALTHRSYCNEATEPVTDNERYEFLGDAVLELAISDLVFRTHPGRSEGQLTQLRARVVNTRTLAHVAHDLGLGPLLRLGVGEERSGGRGRRSILAGAVEAVLGAVHVDGGFEAAASVVERLLGGRLQALEEHTLKDPKSKLQEWAQQHHRVTPVYRIVSVAGPEHASEFEAEVRVGEVLVCRGAGASKKEAHQRAAERAWAEMAAMHAAGEAEGRGDELASRRDPSSEL